jgi:hypothetical protein
VISLRMAGTNMNTMDGRVVPVMINAIFVARFDA